MALPYTYEIGSRGNTGKVVGGYPNLDNKLYLNFDDTNGYVGDPLNPIVNVDGAVITNPANKKTLVVDVGKHSANCSVPTAYGGADDHIS